ncbi:hypothetical protein [Flavobacterium suncheonense]|uniref:Uncharacterized protein n=1 Tax=Flavobacterium suncheonense GH29-5 = DSM 17707 TaxID=1121899 RepID=A0A0A2MBN1_9FLAO|nr:hypothetical protein [Flavobacterium suncheonense]KGO85650.1 hypothetical protein Q764_14000 [Flavobacterium suncheonense GH29-5 = DSM 17707]
MRTIRTYPNIFWLTINLFILTFFGFMILVCLEWLFEFIGFFKHNNEKVGMFFLLLFVTIFFSYFYYQVSNQFTFAKLDSDGIKIFQLLKLKIKNLSFENIKGYSNSEVSYGRVPLNYTSKTIIIYLKNNEERPFELIKLFNFNFKNFTSEIKKTNIIYLGKEPYQPGIYKRKYKF